MLIIRLQRKGRRNDPSFRLVVTDSRKPPKSGEIEILGNYDARKKKLQFKTERIKYWIGKGAKMSPTVKSLLTKNKVI
jgi:small subunit ribosomal protein S16